MIFIGIICAVLGFFLGLTFGRVEGASALERKIIHAVTCSEDYETRVTEALKETLKEIKT